MASVKPATAAVTASSQELDSVVKMQKQANKLTLNVNMVNVSQDTSGTDASCNHITEKTDGCSNCLSVSVLAQTPKSPNSVYSQSVLADSSGCILSGILLCCWDNILGPKLRHLWQVQATDGLLSHSNLLYIASHTLSGEICRDLLSSTIDFKFYALQEREVVLTAFIFGTLGVGDLAVHSLCAILPHEQLSRYLHWHPLCVQYIHRAVPRLRVLLEKESLPAAVEKFTGDLAGLVQLLMSLQEASVPPHIPLSDTLFHPQHNGDSSFLRKALTSHLVACGHTVVLGRSPSKINLMIGTLALFLRPEERRCSRYVVLDHPWLYQPDLWVQGIIKGPDGDVCPSLWRVNLSRFPTAVINLGSQEARITSLPHEQWTTCQVALQHQVTAAWRGEPETYPTCDVFHLLDKPETLVSNFLDEVHALPATRGLRVRHADHFLALLQRKALTLLKYISAESQGGRVDVLHVKKLRHDLGLTVPGDFRIVLAVAERLRPGIYNFVCGTPGKEDVAKPSDGV